MDTVSNTHRQAAPSLAAAFAEVKRTGKHLLKAYAAEGSKEAIGVTGWRAVAKIAIIALSAIAVGLSLYGLIFEAISLGFTRSWDGAAPQSIHMASHGVIIVVFAVLAFILAKTMKRD